MPARIPKNYQSLPYVTETTSGRALPYTRVPHSDEYAEVSKPLYQATKARSPLRHGVR